MLIAGIVFVVVFALLMVGVTAFSGKKTVAARVREISNYTSASEQLSEDEEVMLGLETEKSDFARFLEGILRLTGANIEKKKAEMSLKFMQAGVTSPNAIDYYLFSKRILPILTLGFSAWLVLTSPPDFQVASLFIAFVISVLGLFGPDLYLRNARAKRQVVLMRSFPDALDLILVCVESGLALDAALNRVCRELALAHPEITKELNRTRLELSILNDRSKALQNLAERTDIMPFRALVAALLQSEKFGTSLAETLRVLSEDYRNTRLMIAEQKAGRLPALMTVPMMLLMMPAFVMILMGPGIIALISVLKK